MHKQALSYELRPLLPPASQTHAIVLSTMKETLDQDPSSSSATTFLASNYHDNADALFVASTSHKGTTSVITPFSLANDDNDDGYSVAESHRVSLESVGSTTDGIDILGAEPSATTFLEWSHQQSGRLVTNRYFKRGVLTLIMINSILLGVRTCEFVRNNDKLAAFLDTLLHGIQLSFTLEMILLITYYQIRTVQQGWVLSDLVIMTVSWFLSPILTVLRAFRLIRALRKASGVSVLKQLVKTLLKVFPQMLCIVFLVLLLFYIFAVMFTNFFQDIPEEDLSQNYFASLDKSTFTLFQIMTLDDWAAISQELTQVYPWAWLPVVSFIVSATFFFGSLVIAVVTEAVASVGNERLWKTLEIRETASQHMLAGNGGGGGSGVGRKELRRLEEKVDDLRMSVDQLLRMQVSMQETLALMQQQEVAKGLAKANTMKQTD
jgi:voltage-gated sodium channel